MAVASSAAAHGPQIQITNDNNKIVTRTLHLDGPYSTALTAPMSAYVMPVRPDGGVWYSRPNGELDPILHVPAFPSGPGMAYGYDLADGIGPQAFQEGTAITASFTAGLKLWNGAAFVDAGATQLKAFRGSNPDISTPDANFAVTSDIGPFDSISLAAVAGPSGGSLGYGTDGSEVHGSFRWALLGDGTSPTSASPDGVYLVSLRLSSTQAGLNPSDEYFFVLNKNAPWSTAASAVNSLGISLSRVQWVPEPHSLGLIGSAVIGWLGLGRARKRGNR
jgi:hypothetical protein